MVIFYGEDPPCVFSDYFFSLNSKTDDRSLNQLEKLAQRTICAWNWRSWNVENATKRSHQKLGLNDTRNITLENIPISAAFAGRVTTTDTTTSYTWESTKVEDFPASSVAKFSQVDKWSNITSQSILEYTVLLVRRVAKDLITIVNITSMLPAMICRQCRHMITESVKLYSCRIIFPSFLSKKSSKLILLCTLDTACILMESFFLYSYQRNVPS